MFYVLLFIPLTAGPGASQDLVQAAIKGDARQVEQLVSEGQGDIGAALIYASFWGHKVIVEFLLRNGAHIEATVSYNSDNPLRAAASRGHREIVRILLEAGADVNAPEHIGLDELRPVHLAAMSGHLEIVELLVEHGTDMGLFSASSNKTPWQLAQDHGHVEVARYLQEAGRKKYEQFGPLSSCLNVTGKDIGVAIRDCEEVVRTESQSSSLPRVYLLLGKLKGLGRKCLDRTTAQTYPDHYYWQEGSGCSLYNGYHFQKIVTDFPDSDLVEEAAYELIDYVPRVPYECEGDLACRIAARFLGIERFLALHPGSRFVPKAIKRANAAFSLLSTEGVKNDFDRHNATELLTSYENALTYVPLEYKTGAYELIGDCWVILDARDHARSWYESLLKHEPNYPRREEIEKKLSEIK